MKTANMMCIAVLFLVAVKGQKAAPPPAKVLPTGKGNLPPPLPAAPTDVSSPTAAKVLPTGKGNLPPLLPAAPTASSAPTAAKVLPTGKGKLSPPLPAAPTATSAPTAATSPAGGKKKPLLPFSAPTAASAPTPAAAAPTKADTGADTDAPEVIIVFADDLTATQTNRLTSLVCATLAEELSNVDPNDLECSARATVTAEGVVYAISIKAPATLNLPASSILDAALATAAAEDFPTPLAITLESDAPGAASVPIPSSGGKGKGGKGRDYDDVGEEDSSGASHPSVLNAIVAAVCAVVVKDVLL